MNALAKTEQSELAACEEVIERGRGTFIEVGNALLKIRDGKLYRVTHRTFELYCQERWEMSRKHAHRMIESAGVVANLTPIGDKSLRPQIEHLNNPATWKTPNAYTPKSESVIRPLTKLPPAAQQEVWHEAVETAPEGKVTARHVEKVILNNPQFTPKASKAGAEAESDSEKLWELKQAWKRTGKKDRAAFLKWVDKHQ